MPMVALEEPPLSFELETEDPRPPTPEEALSFCRPTNGYLCPLSANTYGIDFLSFAIRDMETNEQLFCVARDPDTPPIDPAMVPPEMEDAVRSISYDFGTEFLRKKSIATQLQFAVGPAAVENFRMIERHYFRDRLIKSFDFTFGFVIPNSSNSWEAIYDMPALDEELLRQAML